MGTSHRKARVEELIRSFIASELMLIEDPLFSYITVTSAEVSKDLKYATIFWCKAVGAAEEMSDDVTDRALVAVTPYLKKRIAEELGLRYVPALKFRFDKTPYMSEHIESLLREARRKDLAGSSTLERSDSKSVVGESMMESGNTPQIELSGSKE
ncbi:MAG TPA: 30S ribosome-binding factor RbfA [Oligoflexia bacterium]|nr:30S ribosome-binding factor RbfA [Oligoflexia bacterium]HMP49088.1 30S ribosome-binding factor RbfA [Oligoflexia bacterium]